MFLAVNSNKKKHQLTEKVSYSSNESSFVFFTAFIFDFFDFLLLDSFFRPTCATTCFVVDALIDESVVIDSTCKVSGFSPVFDVLLSDLSSGFSFLRSKSLENFLLFLKTALQI